MGCTAVRGVVGTCRMNLNPSRKNGHQRHRCRRVETWPPFAVRFLRRSRAIDKLGINGLSKTSIRQTPTLRVLVSGYMFGWILCYWAFNSLNSPTF